MNIPLDFTGFFHALDGAGHVVGLGFICAKCRVQYRSNAPWRLMCDCGDKHKHKHGKELPKFYLRPLSGLAQVLRNGHVIVDIDQTFDGDFQYERTGQ